MTESTQYSPTDLILATSATAFTGLSIIVAEFNFVSTVLEVVTFAQEVFNAKEKYPNNSFIKALTSSFSLSINQKKTTETTAQTGDFALNVIEPVQKQLETQDPSNIVDFTMDLLNNVFNGLNQKVSSEELQEFKIFLYQLAESIANAAGEGTFGTGVKVSPQEAKVLERLKTTLGL
jgi:hypothetical protein